MIVFHTYPHLSFVDRIWKSQCALKKVENVEIIVVFHRVFHTYKDGKRAVNKEDIIYNSYFHIMWENHLLTPLNDDKN